jgi:hypothetical protein
MSAGMPPSGMPSSLAAREDTGGAPAAAAPQRPPGSAGRVHAALMAHLPLAERLAGPQLCATLRPSALKPRAPGPADSLRSEARPWELEHMRALFPAAEVARHVTEARTRLGLAAEADPALLEASIKLLGQVATH